MTLICAILGTCAALSAQPSDLPRGDATLNVVCPAEKGRDAAPLITAALDRADALWWTIPGNESESAYIVVDVQGVCWLHSPVYWHSRPSTIDLRNAQLVAADPDHPPEAGLIIITGPDPNE